LFHGGNGGVPAVSAEDILDAIQDMTGIATRAATTRECTQTPVQVTAPAIFSSMSASSTLDAACRECGKLVALRAGQLDFLRKFHDVGSPSYGASHEVIHGLPFAVLSRGEHLRTFLDGLRSSGLYRDYQI
jgi:hypothetical protein